MILIGGEEARAEPGCIGVHADSTLTAQVITARAAAPLSAFKNSMPKPTDETKLASARLAIGIAAQKQLIVIKASC